MATKKKKKIKICEFNTSIYGEDTININDILKSIKDNGCSYKETYIKSEIDYSECYYEGDNPGVKLTVYSFK